LRMLIDAKKTDQSVPRHGKLAAWHWQEQKVAAFVSEAKEKEAKDAGATMVGGEDLIKKIKESEKTDFDIARGRTLPNVKIGPNREDFRSPRPYAQPQNRHCLSRYWLRLSAKLPAARLTLKTTTARYTFHQIVGKSNFDSA